MDILIYQKRAQRVCFGWNTAKCMVRSFSLFTQILDVFRTSQKKEKSDSLKNSQAGLLLFEDSY